MWSTTSLPAAAAAAAVTASLLTYMAMKTAKPSAGDRCCSPGPLLLGCVVCGILTAAVKDSDDWGILVKPLPIAGEVKRAERGGRRASQDCAVCQNNSQVCCCISLISRSLSHVEDRFGHRDLSVSAPLFSSLLLSADIEKRMEDLGFFNTKDGPMTNARYMLRMVADVRTASP
jgi:hypothetical protein